MDLFISILEEINEISGLSAKKTNKKDNIIKTYKNKYNPLIFKNLIDF